MLTGHKELGITWICDAINSATVSGDPKHEVELVNIKIPTPDDKHNEMYADALWMRGSYYQNYSFAWSPLSNSSMGSFRLAWEIPLLGPKWHTRRHIWIFATLKVEGSNICLRLIIHWELNMQTGWTMNQSARTWWQPADNKFCWVNLKQVKECSCTDNGYHHETWGKIAQSKTWEKEKVMLVLWRVYLGQNLQFVRQSTSHI